MYNNNDYNDNNGNDNNSNHNIITGGGRGEPSSRAAAVRRPPLARARGLPASVMSKTQGRERGGDRLYYTIQIGITSAEA